MQETMKLIKSPLIPRFQLKAYSYSAVIYSSRLSSKKISCWGALGL